MARLQPITKAILSFSPFLPSFDELELLFLDLELLLSPKPFFRPFFPFTFALALALATRTFLFTLTFLFYLIGLFGLISNRGRVPSFFKDICYKKVQIQGIKALAYSPKGSKYTSCPLSLLREGLLESPQVYINLISRIHFSSSQIQSYNKTIKVSVKFGQGFIIHTEILIVKFPIKGISLQNKRI